MEIRSPIDFLVDVQLEKWAVDRPDTATVRRRLDELNAEQPSLTLFSIKGQEVSVVHPGGVPKEPLVFRDARTAMYKAFFENVLSRARLDLDLVFALDTHDASCISQDVPIFVFQKHAHDKYVLLPDPDFMRYDFYDAHEFDDPVARDFKRDLAVFAGSTTGAGLITMESLDAHRVPRINSALRFKGSDRVAFTLPEIIQCENEQVSEAIEALAIGGPKVSWREQFAAKYLISIDGNGATCSRVIISLKSNSILLKYDSPMRLYYFDCMKPWEHFVPISSDNDILSTMDALEQDVDLSRHIALSGKHLYDDILSRDGVHSYMAKLLEGYSACFFAGPK